jgi:hypothetical protein
LDQGGAAQERLTVATREMPKNKDKPLKNPVKSQATIHNDGGRNVGEQKLAAKSPVKGQATLCQNLSMN